MSHKQADDIVVVDIGGTNIRLGYTRDGEPATDVQSLDSDLLRVTDAYLVLSRTIEQFAAQHSLQPSAVVLGLPGMLDHAADSFSHCNNIPQLEGQGLKAALRSFLGCRVYLQQDTMLQVLGEWQYGAALASTSVFGVFFGTGIGAAYLVDGNPDAQGAAGLQAGHIPVLAQGKPCVCGNTDCIEAYACGHTLVELAATYDCPVEQLFNQQSNLELVRELDQFVLYQSFMLATMTTLFLPDTILIGGGIPRMQGYPHDKLISNVRNHLQKPYPAEQVKIKWASLGNRAFLFGALALLESNKS